jgi:hypothetical protein
MAAKAGHTNMMTDTVIANLPEEALRSILRGLLGGNAPLTSKFNSLVSSYLTSIKPDPFPQLFAYDRNAMKPLTALQAERSRYRCLMGCGRGYESLEVISEILQQVAILLPGNETEGTRVKQEIGFIDGDVVQASTAAQKELLNKDATVEMDLIEILDHNDLVDQLRNCLTACELRSGWSGNWDEFKFLRAYRSLETLLRAGGRNDTYPVGSPSIGYKPVKSKVESFMLGKDEVPRIFCGLWQFSSPAWGSASKMDIEDHFRRHLDAGLVAYGMSE